MRLGRDYQRHYTIDGEPGWTLQAVMDEIPGAAYDAIGKRLRRGVRTWAELKLPARQSRRPVRKQRDPDTALPDRTLEDFAREYAQRLDSERNCLLLSWRGPVDPSPLVASMGVQAARPEHAIQVGRLPMRNAA